MAQIIKRTTITSRNPGRPVVKTVVKEETTILDTIEYFIYYVLGAVEILLTFRFILKLLGANVTNSFVSFIYTISSIFISPFVGIFNNSYAPGIDKVAVLEPSTLTAIVVYLVVAWGIVQLMNILAGEPENL